MLRRPWFWIAFSVVALVATLFSFLYFAEAFPLVQLDIRMDRTTALENAKQLAVEKGWGPEGFRQAASFGADTRVQTFIELEGGGKPAFGRMVTEGPFSPYLWLVRHFREKETTTTTIRFTPSGEPYGFEERLPEDQPGATLDTASARQIAEASAVEEWGVRLDDFSLIEESQEERPGGRLDHTFVFERSERNIGEGRYRLRLEVSGDRFTGLTHFVKIPEGFQRRYDEMRSANEMIGVVGGVAMFLIYIAGGCLVGLFFLMRKKWILWKQALFWAVLIALLQALASINQWPLSWMGYDTALSYQEFGLRQATLILANFVGMTVLMGLTFIAAESLTRRAFPGHIRFWRVWRKDVANTPQILGRTLAGYLLVPVFFAYEIVLYSFSHRLLGWWTPSDALFQPDVLATYFPWLSAIANSLQAGFWEECLFRAVPLAGAALIGRKYGKQTLFIVVAMVLQALIFGAGHAPYATQPAYARVVELVIPSLMFGGLYLCFGLLPAIVLHFAFDVVWFAMPLFVSTGSGAVWDQAWVILLTLVPLWVVALRYWRHGRRPGVSEADLNGAWQAPEEDEEAETVEVSPRAVEAGLVPGLVRVLAILGVAGLAAWLLWADFEADSPPLPTTRSEAIESARQELDRRGIDLSVDWEVMASISADAGGDDRFVWETGGREVYDQLLGSYLRPPVWRVRFARFSGDIEERAEEFAFLVGAGGEVRRFQHTLPESRSGVELEADQARGKALQAIGECCGVAEGQLREISVEPSSLPGRTDWTITFANETVALDEGEARLTARISGDEIVDAYRYVHVPEEWEREERSRETVNGVVQILSGLLLLVVFLAALVIVVINWKRGHFSLRVFAGFSGLTLVLTVLAFANRWPALRAQFSTSQPLSHQIGAMLAGSFMSWLFLAGFVGLVATLAPGWNRRYLPGSRSSSLVLSASLAALVVGLGALLGKLTPSTTPRWADFSAADGFLPHFGPLLGLGGGYLLLTALLLLIMMKLEWMSDGWTRLKFSTSGVLVLIAVALAGVTSDTITAWLLGAVLLAAVFVLGYLFVLRFDLALVPLVVAFYLVFGRVREAFYQAHDGALEGQLLAAAATLVVGYVWWRTFKEVG